MEVSGTAKRAKFATQPRPGRAEFDTTGRWAYAFARRRKPKSEIPVKEFQESGEGIAMNTLANRLQKLDENILKTHKGDEE